MEMYVAVLAHICLDVRTRMNFNRLVDRHYREWCAGCLCQWKGWRLWSRGAGGLIRIPLALSGNKSSQIGVSCWQTVTGLRVTHFLAERSITSRFQVLCSEFGLWNDFKVCLSVQTVLFRRRRQKQKAILKCCQRLLHARHEFLC